MDVEKTYSVAGFSFRIQADEALMERMTNLRPFEAVIIEFPVLPKAEGPAPSPAPKKARKPRKKIEETA